MTGCGTEEASSCRFEAQTALDQHEFSKAIDLLENNPACAEAYSGNERNIDLAAAYMGKAGLSISDLITLASSSADGGSDTFQTFITDASQSRSATALNDLDTASKHLEKALGTGVSCATLQNGTTSNSEKDICLYKGMSDILLSTVTIGYLTTDIEAWADSGTSDDSMNASLCALEFALADQTPDPFSCSKGGSASLKTSSVTFDNGKTYAVSNVALNGLDYENLINDETNSTVLSDGYCTVSFIPCSEGGAGCYACPVDQTASGSNTDVASLLLEALNGGFDATSAALSGDPELQADIETFKAEVDGDGDGDITIDEILSYLAN